MNTETKTLNQSASGSKSPNYSAILAVYLVGLLVGGLYVGMVSPARTVIQEYFSIGDELGIWMITIYTLFYAAFIPVIGKLADKYGRKRTFIACVTIFAVGSLFCGLSSLLHNPVCPVDAQGVGESVSEGFYLLLACRIMQAIGACGMIPVANAEVGATFPKEKRGAALGLTAAVAGVSNVMGAAAGSAVLGVVGNENWHLLFMVAVPVCAVLVVAALVVLPRSETRSSQPLDIVGSILFVVFVLCMLMTLMNLDYFSLAESVLSPLVWGFALAAVLIALLFVRVERRAADPVFHGEYLRSKPIVITMAVSFFVGCTIITMTLIPEFVEFLLGLTAGEGGYYVLAIGVLGMVGPPFAGKLIDKIGVKPVMLFGLIVSVIGYAFLALVSIAVPTIPVLLVGLCIVGLGMGFTMGAPTNYMILENTSPEESGSAIGTIALVRQIGTTIAPALLVGFIGSGQAAGFQTMLLCVVVFNLSSSLLMLIYRSPSRK